MAFSTELVLEAQTGPGVEYRTAPTSARTGSNSTTWTTILTTSVTEGTWMVVVDVKRGAGTLATNILAVNVNGNIQEFKSDAGDAISSSLPCRHLSTVTGPATVTVQSRYAGVAAGTAHIARIG